MKQLICLFTVWTACLLFVVNLSAQEYLHQVIILNEGFVNWATGEVIEPATMGVYDPGLEIYAVVDTLEEAGFISDALILNEMIFVAADGELLKYDANSYELLQTATVPGIRKMALHNDLIYVTRGDFDEQGFGPVPLDSYFQWYDAETLELVGELTVNENGPQFATEGIALSGERIYFAINNAFDWGNEVGLLGAYDIVGDEYIQWDLGETGINPYHVFEVGGAVVSVNNRDYGSTSLSALNVDESVVETIEVSEANAGCLAAVAVDSELRYQITGETVIRQTNAQDLSSSTAWISDCPSYYEMAIDGVSGDVYGSVTDYSTFGFMEIRTSTGQLVNQFDCGISPGVICMDVRNLSNVAYDCTSVGDSAWDYEEIGLYPYFQEAMVGVSWSGEWVFNVPEMLEEPQSGVDFGVHHVDWISFEGLPNWIEESDFALGELSQSSQHCITATGIPTEPGVIEVIATGEVFISLFGAEFSLGEQSFSAILEVIDNPNLIPGCMYETALNYLSYAEIDDGSCLFAGCTDESAGNYSPLATIDDGSCGEPCSTGSESSCATDVNYDGAVNVSDLLLLLSEFGANCE